MRQIVLDTETTGLNPRKGDRIVEVGCVELVDRKLTGKHYHVYINPERDIPEEVIAIHGIDNEKVKDAPKFRDIAEELWVFLEGAELVIHNAAFDVGFIDHELATVGHVVKKIQDICTITDSLQEARKMHPGQRNSLDALCKRYDIDNTHRELHGALLDAQILADVYMAMTGGQVTMTLAADEQKRKHDEPDDHAQIHENYQLKSVLASPQEMEEHEKMLENIANSSDQAVLWKS